MSGVVQMLMGGSSRHMTAVASPASVSGTAAGATVTSNASTVAVSGQAGAVTYAWTQVSGGVISATAPTLATSAFQGTGMGIGEFRSAVYKCVVTDAFGSVDSNTVSIDLERV